MHYCYSDESFVSLPLVSSQLIITNLCFSLSMLTFISVKLREKRKSFLSIIPHGPDEPVERLNFSKCFILPANRISPKGTVRSR